jgi:hypothetical protein
MKLQMDRIGFEWIHLDLRSRDCHMAMMSLLSSNKIENGYICFIENYRF